MILDAVLLLFLAIMCFGFVYMVYYDYKNTLAQTKLNLTVAIICGGIGGVAGLVSLGIAIIAIT